MRRIAAIAWLCVLTAGAIYAQNAGMFGAQVALQRTPNKAYSALSFTSCLVVTNSQSPFTFTLVSGAATQDGITFTSASGCFSGTPTTGTPSWTISGHGTSGPSTGNTVVSFSILTLSSILIGPSGSSININSTLQLTEQNTWSDTSTTSTPGSVMWACSGTGFSSVSSAGVFTSSGSAGSPTCTASLTAPSLVTSNTLTVTVASSAPTITNSSPLLCSGHLAQINQACPQIQFQATGGTPPYTWTITSGAPTGCGSSLTSAGVLTCTPTASGTFSSFIIKVTDSMAANTSKTFTMNVASLSSIAVTPGTFTLLQGTTQQMTATGTYSDSSTANVTNQVVGGGGGSLSFGTVCTPVGTGGSATSVSVSCAVSSGQLAFLVCESNTASISFQLPTDSASQTWPAADATRNDFNSSMAIWHFANSAALTSETCHASASTGIMTVHVFTLNNAATSTPMDGTATNSSGAVTPVTSLQSGSLTTTNANDALIYCTKQAPQTSYSIDSGYNLSTVFNNTRFACGTLIVSTTQTTQPTISWTGGSSLVGGIIAAIKSAATSTTGWSEADVSGSGVATVSGTGLVTAKNVGTATIQACIGATCGTANLTVNASGADTSLVVTPNPGSATVGSTIQFQAVGNVTGNNYNAPPTVWGAQ